MMLTGVFGILFNIPRFFKRVSLMIYQSLKLLHLIVLAKSFFKLFEDTFFLAATRFSFTFLQHHQNGSLLFCCSSCRTEVSIEHIPPSEILAAASNSWSIQAWEFSLFLLLQNFCSVKRQFVKIRPFQFSSKIQASEFPSQL